MDTVENWDCTAAAQFKCRHCRSEQTRLALTLVITCPDHPLDCPLCGGRLVLFATGGASFLRTLGDDTAEACLRAFRASRERRRSVELPDQPEERA